MMPKPLKCCAVCKERISWGGRILRTLHKHSPASLCIHRDRWHCASCCFMEKRNPVDVALEKTLLDALS